MAESIIEVNDSVSVAIFRNMLNSLDDCLDLGIIKYDKVDFLNKFFLGYNICRMDALVTDSVIEWIKYECIDYIEPDSDIYFFIEDSIRRTFIYAVKKFKNIKINLGFSHVTLDNRIFLYPEYSTVDLKESLGNIVMEHLSTVKHGNLITVNFREHQYILAAIDDKLDTFMDHDAIIADMITIVVDENIKKKDIANKVLDFDLDKYYLAVDPPADFNCVEVADLKKQLDFELVKNSVTDLLTLLTIKLKESFLAADMYENGEMIYLPLPLHQSNICFFKKEPNSL